MVQKSLNRCNKINKKIKLNGKRIFVSSLNKTFLVNNNKILFNLPYILKKNTSKIFINRYILKKIINFLTKKGKKVLARKILKKIFINLREITGKNPYIILYLALNNLKPHIGTRKMRKAGRIEEVPVPFKKNRQTYLIFKWFFLSIKENKLKNYKCFNLIIKEILDLLNNGGNSIVFKKKLIENAYRNRAICHFRWY